MQTTKPDALTIVAFALASEVRRRSGMTPAPIDDFPQWLAHIQVTMPIYHRELLDESKAVLEQLDKAGLLKDTAI